MISQEKLVARERRGIALLAEIGGVAVQQGMEGCACGTRGGGATARHLDPVALSGKGIRRQADEAACGLAMQLLPIQFQARDPQLEEEFEAPPLDPCFDGALERVVRGERRQEIVAFASTAPVEPWTPVIAQDRLELLLQLRDRPDEQAQTFLHQLASAPRRPG